MSSQAEVKGSFSLLFSTLTRVDGLFLLLGVVVAVVAGIIPTIMAKIIGAVFNVFTAFNPDVLPVSDIPQERKDSLMHATLQAVWELCTLGVGTMILSTAMISVWIIIGEKVGRGWRLRVYQGFSSKEVKWFETDLNEKAGMDEGSGSIGSGGIMAKFAR
jgi:ATP-binding cassette subfamily B (MDR/TAP) protein 1